MFGEDTMTHNYDHRLEKILGKGKRMMSFRIVRVTLVLAFVCSLAAASWSQGAQGTIVGRVTDSTGAVVDHASVTITNVGTNIAVSTKTTQTGDFTFPFLKPGVYSLNVEVNGFDMAEVKDITLQVGQTERTDFVLKPGAVTTTISVSANNATLDTDSSAVGQVISERQILDLPMENRDFLSLLLLSPGASTTVVNGGGDYTQGNDVVNVSGARIASNGYFLDGLTNNDPYYTNSIVNLSLDAIQEFKEQASTYSAQYGESASQINISTKSGTNDLHGTMFEFLRNNALDAVSAFTPAGPVPPLHLNDYGYSLGGPVYIPKIYNGHNHTFFFANFERFKASTSGTLYSIAPTADELKGLIPSSTPIVDPTTGQPFAQDSSGNYIIPQSRWSRLSLVSTKTPGDYFPVAGALANGTNSVTVITNPSISNQQTYRIDQKLGSKDNLAARFTLTNNVSTSQGIDIYATDSSNIRSQSWNVIETHEFNDRLVNNGRVGWMDYNWAFTGKAAPSADISALGETNTFPQNGAVFPQVQFTNGNFSDAGGAQQVPYTFGSQIWNIEDSLFWVHGRHGFTFGFLGVIDNGISNGVDNIMGEFGFDGSFTVPQGGNPTPGNTWADFLLGDTVDGMASVPTAWGLAHPSPPPWYIDQIKLAGYVNDDWKISKNLTLNLGLRYDFQSMPNLQQALWASMSVPGGVVCTTDKQFVQSGEGGTLFAACPDRSTPKAPFAPRFGFAYLPSPNGNTVIRGGYGIFFDQYELHEWDGAVNFPWVETYSAIGGNFDNSFPASSATITSSDVAGLYNSEPPFVKAPYVQQWSFGVEQSALRTVKINAGYVGSMGTHLMSRLAANQPYSYNATDTPAEREARYPYYNFGTYGLNGTPFSPGYLDQPNYVAASNYNALQSSVNFQGKDLVLLAAYTWASSMDDSSSVLGTGLDNAGWQGPMDAHDIHRDYAKSSFDVNQRFVASFVYQLPIGHGQPLASGVNRAGEIAIGGWQVNGIYTAQGGIPFNTAASDIGFVLSAYGQRSNKIGNPYPAGFHKSSSEWFDTSAYSQPPQGTFGTEPRNDLRAPGVNSLDFSLFKDFPLAEQLKLEFRGEAFNALNHVQLGSPNDNVAASNFGVINGVNVPGRIIQLGIKVKF